MLNRNNYHLLANFLTDGLDFAETQRPLRMQWDLNRNGAVRMRRRRVGSLAALDLDEPWDEENVGQLGILTYLDETGGKGKRLEPDGMVAICGGSIQGTSLPQSSNRSCLFTVNRKGAQNLPNRFCGPTMGALGRKRQKNRAESVTTTPLLDHVILNNFFHFSFL